MSVEIKFMPDGKSTPARAGTTLLEAARRAKVHIRTRCAGKAACLMCKVCIDPDAQTGLQPMNANERNKLGGLQEQGYRLACQAKANGQAPVIVTVPEDPLKSAVRKLLDQQQEEDW
ncbi:2Fe-2S iron-sulfur cluster-binding protein [Paenibacillus validus]|nr:MULTISPECIES: 2Fe-2S iron-sulfur cluster-binding protein [Paenibacillus]MED4601447.1 2Fe-2S iron-sulfur cluster-binding protein [Paenibacillus validus]MED4607760.1 2Fe-2S iron-sulfur cluster-binding protein [Paenibacillus validus]